MPSKNRSIFFDEWQACLRAHYEHVIRSDDAVTEPTLHHVLLNTGLTEEDLQDLRAQALAGTLDIHAMPAREPDDPDLEAEIDAAEDVEAETFMSGPDDDASPIDEEPDADLWDDDDEEDEDDQDLGQQLSLF